MSNFDLTFWKMYVYLCGSWLMLSDGLLLIWKLGINLDFTLICNYVVYNFFHHAKSFFCSQENPDSVKRANLFSKIVHVRGEGVKNDQNLVHVGIEWPQTLNAVKFALAWKCILRHLCCFFLAFSTFETRGLWNIV